MVSTPHEIATTETKSAMLLKGLMSISHSSGTEPSPAEHNKTQQPCLLDNHLHDSLQNQADLKAIPE